MIGRARFWRLLSSITGWENPGADRTPDQHFHRAGGIGRRITSYASGWTEAVGCSTRSAAEQQIANGRTTLEE